MLWPTSCPRQAALVINATDSMRQRPAPAPHDKVGSVVRTTGRKAGHQNSGHTIRDQLFGQSVRRRGDRTREHIFPGAAELGHGDPGGVPTRRLSQINHSLAVNLIPAQCQWLGLEWKGLLRLCPGRLEAQREIEGFNADRVEAPAMQACAFPGFGVPGPSRVVRTERPPPKTNFRYSHQPQPGPSSCARIRLDRP